jgi:hypothetical protein
LATVEVGGRLQENKNDVMVPVVTETAKVLVPGKKQPPPDAMLRAPVQRAHSS